MKAPRIGVALGGGGARGWAHVGALRALDEVGLAPDVIAGTSMGAAVAAAYAAGKLDEFEEWALALDRRGLIGLFDLSFQGGLIGAHRVFDELSEILPDIDIEELPMPFGAVATDLEHGTAVRLVEGSLRTALRASVAIPGLISPIQVGGRWVVDGGLVDPVPVGLVRALGAEVVIAVELSANRSIAPQLTPFLEPPTAEMPKIEPPPGASTLASADALPPEEGAEDDAVGTPSFFDHLGDLTERFWSQLRPAERPVIPDPPPSVYEVISQSLYIMQVRIARSVLAGEPPDLHVVPRLQSVQLMDFDKAEEAIEEGARAVRTALAAQADFHLKDPAK